MLRCCAEVSEGLGSPQSFCPRLRHPEVINGRWAHQAPLAANRHRAKVSRVSTMPTAEGGRGQGSGTHLRLPHSRPRVGAHGPGLATGFHEVAAAWGLRGGDFGEGWEAPAANSSGDKSSSEPSCSEGGRVVMGNCGSGRARCRKMRTRTHISEAWSPGSGCCSSVSTLRGLGCQGNTESLLQPCLSTLARGFANLVTRRRSAPVQPPAAAPAAHHAQQPRAAPHLWHTQPVIPDNSGCTCKVTKSWQRKCALAWEPLTLEAAEAEGQEGEKLVSALPPLQVTHPAHIPPALRLVSNSRCHLSVRDAKRDLFGI